MTTAAVIVGAMACADRGVIEYRGSAMSETTPDSAAQLTLTLWERTDTSFGGFLRVTAPLTGSAGAYAWHEGSALKIVTSAEQGDTIVWTSQAADDSIGGHYVVVGGPNKDQGGTWRATRVRGQAVSKATLAEAPPARLPVGALAGVVMFAALIAIATRWIRREPQPKPVDPAAGLPFPTHPRGISGWLAFFVLGQCLTPIRALLEAPSTIETTRASWSLSAVMPWVQPFLAVEVLFHAALIVVPVVGVVLIVKRNRFAPRFCLAYLTGIVVYMLFDSVGGYAFGVRLASFMGAAWQSASEDVTSALPGNGRTAVWALLWAMYWAQSMRVRATFGADALDRPLFPTPATPVPSPSLSDQPPSSAPS